MNKLCHLARSRQAVSEETKLGEPNSLMVNFYPQKAGVYPCKLLVRGAPGALASLAPDLRVFTLECTVSTPPIQTSLEFRVPARQKVSQELPLVNHGAEDWLLNATFQGSKLFAGRCRLFLRLSPTLPPVSPLLARLLSRCV